MQDRRRRATDGVALRETRRGIQLLSLPTPAPRSSPSIPAAALQSQRVFPPAGRSAHPRPSARSTDKPPLLPPLPTAPYREVMSGDTLRGIARAFSQSALSLVQVHEAGQAVFPGLLPSVSNRAEKRHRKTAAGLPTGCRSARPILWIRSGSGQLEGRGREEEAQPKS